MSSVMNGLQGLDDLQVAAAAEHASRVLQALIFHRRDTGRGVARYESKTRALPPVRMFVLCAPPCAGRWEKLAWTLTRIAPAAIVTAARVSLVNSTGRNMPLKLLLTRTVSEASAKMLKSPASRSALSAKPGPVSKARMAPCVTSPCVEHKSKRIAPRYW